MHLSSLGRKVDSEGYNVFFKYQKEIKIRHDTRVDSFHQNAKGEMQMPKVRLPRNNQIPKDTIACLEAEFFISI